MEFGRNRSFFGHLAFLTQVLVSLPHSLTHVNKHTLRFSLYLHLIFKIPPQKDKCVPVQFSNRFMLCSFKGREEKIQISFLSSRAYNLVTIFWLINQNKHTEAITVSVRTKLYYTGHYPVYVLHCNFHLYHTLQHPKRTCIPLPDAHSVT